MQIHILALLIPLTAALPTFPPLSPRFTIPTCPPLTNSRPTLSDFPAQAPIMCDNLIPNPDISSGLMPPLSTTTSFNNVKANFHIDGYGIVNRKSCLIGYGVSPDEQWQWDVEVQQLSSGNVCMTDGSAEGDKGLEVRGWNQTVWWNMFIVEFQD